jgi:hypothetical protein
VSKARATPQKPLPGRWDSPLLLENRLGLRRSTAAIQNPAVLTSPLELPFLLGRLTFVLRRQAGVPAEEAQHRYVVPEKFKNFPVFAWGFTIGPAITKLYAEWQGK